MEQTGPITNMGTFIKSSNSLIPVNTFRSAEVSSSQELQPVRIYNKSNEYEVKIIFINGESVSDYVDTAIYNDYDLHSDGGYISLNSSDDVGDITSADGYIILHLPTNSNKLVIVSESDDPSTFYGNIMCSANITSLGAYSTNESIGELDINWQNNGLEIDNNDISLTGKIIYSFSISGNGTITIDGASWSY